MQKWEYLVVSGMYHNMETVVKMTNKGLELVKQFIDKELPLKYPNNSYPPSDVVQSTRDAVAQYIAQLGDEGWEMIGVGNNGEIYFKRPKP